MANSEKYVKFSICGLNAARAERAPYHLAVNPSPKCIGRARSPSAPMANSEQYVTFSICGSNAAHAERAPCHLGDAFQTGDYFGGIKARRSQTAATACACACGRFGKEIHAVLSVLAGRFQEVRRDVRAGNDRLVPSVQRRLPKDARVSEVRHVT